jgi:hypothetical protein
MRIRYPWGRDRRELTRGSNLQDPLMNGLIVLHGPWPFLIKKHKAH